MFFGAIKERDMFEQVIRTLKLLSLIAVLFLICCVLFFDVSSCIKNGFVAGMAIGAINTVLTYIGLSCSLVERQYYSKKHMVCNKATFLLRWTLIIALIFLASRVDWLNIYAVFIGVIMAPVISFLDFGVAAVFNCRGSTRNLEDK